MVDIATQIAMLRERPFQPVSSLASGVQAGSALREMKQRKTLQDLLAGGNIEQAAAIDPQATAQYSAVTGAQRQERLQSAARLAAGVLSAPAVMRPQAYAQSLSQAQQMGMDVSQLPQQYSPDAESRLQFIVNQASSIGAESQPASVQEWRYYQGLPEEQQSKYLQMKRAQPTFRMGDVQMMGEPVTGTARPFIPVGEGPQTQAQIQERVSRQAAKKTAMEEGVKAAGKMSTEAFQRLEKIKTSIANYDEAISLVEQGAGTGVVESRLPSVRQASIALDNLQGRLGLDVIGTTTFGALSEAELRFALDTALPKKMEGPALINWLREKQAAQRKLSAYLEQASTFLGTPGNTVKDWIEFQRGNQPTQEAPPAPPAPSPQASQERPPLSQFGM